MSKVLVDRELLERAMYARDGKELIAANREIRATLARPAEAEGVGSIQCPASHPAECYAPGTQVVHASLVHGVIRQADALSVALSAVTAERDKLKGEVARLESAWHVKTMNRKDQVIAQQEQENDKIKAENAQLRAECERLRAFSNEIVSGAFEGGSFDGGDIQDMGVRHGLLRIEQREDECGEVCACREYGFPSECYRKTELLRAAMAAKE